MGIKRRALHALLVCGALVLLSLWLSLASIPRLIQPANYLDSLLVSLWLSNPLNTDQDSLNKKVIQKVKQRRKNDLEDVFWRVDTRLRKDQTELEIPPYFFQNDKDRPDVQPFDPRFTLAFYYYFIRKHALTSPQGITAPFHWADWMDMSVLDQYIFTNEHTTCSFMDQREKEEEMAKKHDKPNPHESLDPAEYCLEDKDLPFTHDDGNRLRMGFNVKKYPGRMEASMGVIAGRSYMYTHAPPPASVIFMTDNGSYNITTTGAKEKLLHNGIVDDYIKLGKKTINTLEEFTLLNQEVPSFTERVISDYQIHLSHLDFVLNPSEIIDQLQSRSQSKPLTQQEEKYLQSVQYSVATQNDPPKFFKEARIFNTVIGDHYDWRFFNGIKLHSEEQELTLHRMVRTWLSFCRKQGIRTWMAHGSLLSWYWNGIGFPWDNDIDVQVPIMDLHKLAMYFNQSLVVEDGKDGFSRYFIDITSSITVREKSNGKNNIDARFIDVDSGLYIDITALAVSKESAPDRYTHGSPKEVKDDPDKLNVNDKLQLYNCRNQHFSSLQEVSPLFKSFVEGKVAYIPKRYSDILTAEYNRKGLLDKFFSHRLFMPQLRLWIHQDKLRFFLRDRNQWLKYFSAKTSAELVGLTKPDLHGDLTTREVAALIEMNEKDLLDLMLDDSILIEYAVLREMTAIHENEIMRLLFGKSTEKIVLRAKEFSPLKFEPFLARLRQDYASFESEVQRYIGLHDKYILNPTKEQEKNKLEEKESEGKNPNKDNSKKSKEEKLQKTKDTEVNENK